MTYYSAMIVCLRVHTFNTYLSTGAIILVTLAMVHVHVYGYGVQCTYSIWCGIWYGVHTVYGMVYMIWYMMYWHALN